MEEYLPFLRFNAAGHSTEVLIAVCAVMLIAGLLSLLYGYRVYKLVVVVATGLVGAYVGWTFLYPRLPEKYAFLAPLVLGLLGALAALPMQKMMVFLVGAAVGFVSLGPVVAEVIWKRPEGPTSSEYLIAGIVVFLAMGIMALLLFKPVVIIATSMFGSTLVLSAVVTLVEKTSEAPKGLYQTYPRELAWIFVGITVVGVAFQVATRGKRPQKSR